MYKCKGTIICNDKLYLNSIFIRKSMLVYIISLMWLIVSVLSLYYDNNIMCGAMLLTAVAFATVGTVIRHMEESAILSTRFEGKADIDSSSTIACLELYVGDKPIYIMLNRAFVYSYSVVSKSLAIMGSRAKVKYDKEPNTDKQYTIELYIENASDLAKVLISMGYSFI